MLHHFQYNVLRKLGGDWYEEDGLRLPYLCITIKHIF